MTAVPCKFCGARGFQLHNSDCPTQRKPSGQPHNIEAIMGEAKVKEDIRRIHASMIVGKIEEHIKRLIYDAEMTKEGVTVDEHYLDESRDDLIKALVTPPPKP